jgi:enoyl-CoA hydratase
LTTSDLVDLDRDGPVWTVRIARPEVHNALNADVLAALDTVVAQAGAEPGVRAVVLTGAGEKAFSAGADLEELEHLDAPAARATLERGQAVLRRIERSPAPVIAAVNGLALGGGFELVLASAFAVVSETASFGLPEAGLGLMPGYGGTQRLARLAGPQVARFVMLTGRRLDAWRAHTLGLAVVPPVASGELAATADELAREVAARGPAACRSILDAVDRAGDTSLETGLALETSLAAMAVGGDESSEGIAAFREKRRPAFHDVAPDAHGVPR